MFSKFCFLTLILAFLSRRAFSKGCEKNGETWTCKDIYLETDKKLPITDLSLSVKNIKFENCVIPTISIDVFNSFQNTIDIDLEDNQIENIIPGALDELKMLNKLHLRSNKITEIKVKTLNSLVNVKELNLHYNQISILENKCFSNMSQLELLRLGWNKLTYISENIFVGLNSLKHLFLNNNLITRLAVGSFRDLPLLYQLDIGYNLITKLEFGTISKCGSLSILTLNFNNISKINEDILYGFSKLHTLYISNNNISSLDVQKLLSNVPKLEKISLNNNSWFCNSLTYNVHILKVHNITITDNDTELTTNFQGIKCNIPEELIPTNINILDRLENILVDEFSKSNFSQNIQNKILNSTNNYVNSTFLRYLEDDFKNTTFFKYFQQDFSSSNFSKQLNKHVSEVFDAIQHFSSSLRNISLGTHNDARSTPILQYFENGIFISACMVFVIAILIFIMIILCCMYFQKKRTITISNADAFL